MPGPLSLTRRALRPPRRGSDYFIAKHGAFRRLSASMANDDDDDQGDAMLSERDRAALTPFEQLVECIARRLHRFSVSDGRRRKTYVCTSMDDDDNDCVMYTSPSTSSRGSSSSSDNADEDATDTGAEMDVERAAEPEESQSSRALRRPDGPVHKLCPLGDDVKEREEEKEEPLPMVECSKGDPPKTTPIFPHSITLPMSHALDRETTSVRAAMMMVNGGSGLRYNYNRSSYDDPWTCSLNLEHINGTVYCADGNDMTSVRQIVSQLVLDDVFAKVDSSVESRLAKRRRNGGTEKYTVIATGRHIRVKVHVGDHRLYISEMASVEEAKHEARLKMLE